MKMVEKVARTLCWKNGCNPDTSLGGDQQNWLWMEYVDPAEAVIDIIMNDLKFSINVAARRNFDDELGWTINMRDSNGGRSIKDDN